MHITKVSQTQKATPYLTLNTWESDPKGLISLRLPVLHRQGVITEKNNEEEAMKALECSKNKRAADIPRELFSRTEWVYHT